MKHKILYCLVSIICLISLVVMGFALIHSGTNTENIFVPPPFDDMVIEGVPNLSDDMGYSDVDAQLYHFSICGSPEIVEDGLAVYLTNPADSGVWLRVRIFDDSGNVLGESGIVRAGEFIRSVDVTDAYHGKAIVLKIMAYEPNSYYSAGAITLNTTIS